MSDNLFAFVVLMGIVAIALFGGVKNKGFVLLENPGNTTFQNQNDSSTSSNPNTSQYKDSVDFYWGSFGNKADQEYLQITANSNNTAPINISGWKIVDNGSKAVVTIPRSTGLYGSGESNYDQDVVLLPGEVAYIITGKSPVGYGMHANICSGYLSQFNSFTPSLYSYCPTAYNESSTTVSRTPINNNCIDLIESTGSCTTRTVALDNSYTSQCQQLFSTTLTYQGCVNLHKKDGDFYSPKKWYVYLKRESALWNVSRQSITLMDSGGKAIKTITK
jgi:hypothetical protein